jgi:hypothetical protein
MTQGGHRGWGVAHNETARQQAGHSHIHVDTCARKPGAQVRPAAPAAHISLSKKTHLPTLINKEQKKQKTQSPPTLQDVSYSLLTKHAQQTK